MCLPPRLSHPGRRVLWDCTMRGSFCHPSLAQGAAWDLCPLHQHSKPSNSHASSCQCCCSCRHQAASLLGSPRTWELLHGRHGSKPLDRCCLWTLLPFPTSRDAASPFKSMVTRRSGPNAPAEVCTGKCTGRAPHLAKILGLLSTQPTHRLFQPSSHSIAFLYASLNVHFLAHILLATMHHLRRAADAYELGGNVYAGKYC